MLRIVAVKRLDHCFSDASHLVDSTVSEVGDLFRMSQRPTRVGPSSGVPCIRAHRGVTLVPRASHLTVTNLSSKTTVHLVVQLPVLPATFLAEGMQPHLDPDRGKGDERL